MKRDVIEDGSKHDVIDNGSKHDVIDDGSKGDDTNDAGGSDNNSDVSRGNEKDGEESVKVQKEIFLEEELKLGAFLNKGNDEDEDTSDEIVILKHKKASNVSLRKSLRIQNRRREEKKKLQQLQDQKGKKLAAKFVFIKSSVTYWPPVGYYGKFGVAEKSVEGATDSPDIIEIDEEEDDLIIDDVLN